LEVSVFVLGSVRTVRAEHLAVDGHEIISVDPVPTKVDGGLSAIVEAAELKLLSEH
jgi:hypothetical protein